MSEALRVLFVVHNHPRIRPGGAEAYALELHRELNQTDGFSSMLLARAELDPGYRPGGMNPLPDAENDLLFYTSGGSFDHFFGRSRARGATAARFSAFLADAAQMLSTSSTRCFSDMTWFAPRGQRCQASRSFSLSTSSYRSATTMGKWSGSRTATFAWRRQPRRCNECFPQLSTGHFALRKRFIHRQLDCVDRFIAPSKFIRDRYVDWGIPSEKITVEEYGRRPMRETGDERIAPSRSILGFFGQITQFKGVDVLLRAMAILAERGSPAHLRLHGANLEMQVPAFQYEIARLLEQTRANVTVVGQYNHGQLAELMKLVDWVVVPSIWWENSPLVIQEAFGHRRPVICSNIGGMAEKVEDGVTGCHFSVGDPQSLAETIETAISDPGHVGGDARQNRAAVRNGSTRGETFADLRRADCVVDRACMNSSGILTQRATALWLGPSTLLLSCAVPSNEAIVDVALVAGERQVPCRWGTLGSGRVLVVAEDPPALEQTRIAIDIAGTTHISSAFVADADFGVPSVLRSLASACENARIDALDFIGPQIPLDHGDGGSAIMRWLVAALREPLPISVGAEDEGASVALEYVGKTSAAEAYVRGWFRSDAPPTAVRVLCGNGSRIELPAAAVWRDRPEVDGFFTTPGKAREFLFLCAAPSEAEADWLVEATDANRSERREPPGTGGARSAPRTRSDPERSRALQGRWSRLRPSPGASCSPTDNQRSWRGRSRVPVRVATGCHIRVGHRSAGRSSGSAREPTARILRRPRVGDDRTALRPAPQCRGRVAGDVRWAFGPVLRCVLGRGR